ncbi:MAG: Rab GTPase ypt31, partial [Paramarteilia canceri]
VVIGAAGVGKTQLIKRFVENEFETDSKSTIGVDFYTKIFSLTKKGDTDKEIRIKLQIWDTAGCERYNAITRNYYKKAKGVIVVYDITRQETFSQVNTGINQALEHNDSDLKICIVGNKTDLNHLRQIESEESKKLALDRSTLHYETSASTPSNVTELFKELAEEIYKSSKEEIIETKKPPTKNVDINKSNNNIDNDAYDDNFCCL